MASVLNSPYFQLYFPKSIHLFTKSAKLQTRSGPFISKLMAAANLNGHSQEAEILANISKRNCAKETDVPVNGKHSGEIPKWVKGCLLRNGPGMMKVGEDSYKHWFDGLAILQNFTIKEGQVTYRSKFIRSKSYKKNTAANRIVVSEFGTGGFPDPCSTIFDRFKSVFSGEATDNTNINVLKIGDQFYAATETNVIRRVDIETLDTLEKENLTNYVAVNTATAHAHYEKDGTTYNLGNSFSKWPSYNFIKFPPSKDNGEKNKSLEEASVVCKIHSSSMLYPSYYHSFGASENYLILAEQPLLINIPKFVWRVIRGGAFGDALQWEPKQLVQFHVVEKKTGKELPLKYTANPFMVFHHANAYEEDGHLVVDLCAYADGGQIIKSLYMEELGANDLSIWQKTYAQVRRYVLPLVTSTEDVSTIPQDQNLVTLADSSAVAYKQKDGSILCHAELFSEGLDTVEMPQINYDAYNGKKYKYIYAIGKKAGGFHDTALVKIDTPNKSFILWSESGKCPTEPVFVPNPNNQDEDDGVILSSLLHLEDETKVTLLVLDAKNFKELARVEFITNSAVTNNFHGPYVPM